MAKTTAAVLGGYSTGHGCFPPTALVQSSQNVYSGNMLVGRVGDQYAPHTCGQTTHAGSQRAISDGSSNVYVNGISCGKLGSNINCGDAVGNHGLSTGAKKVYIGG